MDRRDLLLTLASFGPGCVAWSPARRRSDTAGIIFHNGVIPTLEADQPQVRALGGLVASARTPGLTGLKSKVV